MSINKTYCGKPIIELRKQKIIHKYIFLISCITALEIVLISIF